MKTLKNKTYLCDDTPFNGRIQNTTRDCSDVKSTFPGPRSTNYRNQFRKGSDKTFPGIEKLLSVSCNSHSNPRNEK